MFNKDKIRLYRENLEEAKFTLVIVQNSLNFNLAAQTRETIRSVESGVAKLLVNQDSAMSQTTVEYQSVQSSLTSLQQDVQMVMSSLPSVMNNQSADFMASLEKSLSTLIEKKLTECISTSQAAHSIQHEELEYGHMMGEEELGAGNVSTFFKVPKNPKANGLRGKGKRVVFCRNFFTPVGCLTFRLLQNWNIRTSGSEDCSFEAWFIFIPRRWLSRKAFVLSGKLDPSDCGLTKLHLEFRPTIDSNSEIFKACKAGDIDQVKYLFQNKLASPYAVNLEGESLILVSATQLVSFYQC